MLKNGDTCFTCLQATAHEDYGDYYFKGDRRIFLLFSSLCKFSRIHIFSIFLTRCLFTFLCCISFFVLFYYTTIVLQFEKKKKNVLQICGEAFYREIR